MLVPLLERLCLMALIMHEENSRSASSASLRACVAYMSSNRPSLQEHVDEAARVQLLTKALCCLLNL